jgi:hypothetical protein
LLCCGKLDSYWGPAFFVGCLELGLDREVGVCTWYIGEGLYQVQNKENVPGTGEWFCTRYTGQPEPLGAWLDWDDLSQGQSGQSEPGSF